MEDIAYHPGSGEAQGLASRCREENGFTISLKFENLLWITENNNFTFCILAEESQRGGHRSTTRATRR